MVVDTSVILAIYFNEPHAEWAIKQIDTVKSDLSMSVVNLAESLILMQNRNSAGFKKLKENLLSDPISFIPVSLRHAELAAEARIKYPLNLGDCFAYALAKDSNLPIITLDSDFIKSDLKVIHPKNNK